MTGKDTTEGIQSMAVLSGPVIAGEKGVPFGRPNLDFAGLGYLEKEYFLEGTATKYRPGAGTELGRDGRWDVEPAGTAPYRTRVRPGCHPPMQP